MTIVPKGFSFTHFGVPAAQGSKTLVSRDRYGRRLRHPRMIDSNKSALDKWRKGIAKSAKEFGGPESTALFTRDVRVVLEFHFKRPKSHYLKDGNLGKSREVSCRPRRKDADKLARAVLDALTGVLYRDDRDVALLAVERKWATFPDEDFLRVHVFPAPDYGSWNFS